MPSSIGLGEISDCFVTLADILQVSCSKICNDNQNHHFIEGMEYGWCCWQWYCCTTFLKWTPFSTSLRLWFFKSKLLFSHSKVFLDNWLNAFLLKEVNRTNTDPEFLKHLMGKMPLNTKWQILNQLQMCQGAIKSAKKAGNTEFLSTECQGAEGPLGSELFSSSSLEACREGITVLFFFRIQNRPPELCSCFSFGKNY